MKKEDIYQVLKAWTEKDNENSSIDWIKLASEDLARRMEYNGDINRVEIINHNSSQYEIGRIFTFRGKLEYQLQDDMRTLKVFI